VEYVFVLPDAYVQVAVVPDSTVIWFAVTTRSPRFRPRLNYCPTTLPDIELGRTTFGELAITPNAVTLLGRSEFGHAESVYLGDAGSFQTYVFAHIGERSEEPPDFPTYFDGAGQPALGWFGAADRSPLNGSTLDDPAREDPAREDPAPDDPAPDDPARDDPACAELCAGATVNTYGVFGAYRPDQSIDGFWWRVPFPAIADHGDITPPLDAVDGHATSATSPSTA